MLLNRALRSLPWIISVFFLNTPVFAQLPALQPEQDCINALSVCQNVFVQPNSYVGEGVNPNEINPGPSCLNSGEKNDVWYIFTVQVSGNLSFTITPFNLSDDYDWAVYDLTNASCSDIFNNAALEVSCNYSGTPGLTGPNGSGAGGGSPFNPVLPVLAGQTFVVNVSNFSSSASGYNLNFGTSTAVIFDNVPPAFDTVSATCGGDIHIKFTENVVCSSVTASDFSVTGPSGINFTVTSVTGAACAAGGTFENEFVLTVSPSLSFSGNYTIALPGQVLDNCGNIGTLDTAFITINIPNLTVTATPDTICAGDPVTLSVLATSGFTYNWSGGLTGLNPTVVPSTSSIYTVTAVDPAGCAYSGFASVFVKPAPSADVIFSQDTLCGTDVVTATYAGTGDANSTYNWNFGAAQVLSGTGAGPYQMNWNAPGTYPVILSVVKDGCPGPIDTFNIRVNLQPTALMALAPEVCTASQTTCAYTGNASPSANYFWDFDGALVVSGSGQGPYTLVWTVPGPKNVCLQVEENGCVSSFECKSILVNALPAIAIAPIDNQCLKGNIFQFTYNGIAPITTYKWNFGDQSTISNLSAPNHTYTSAGLRTVVLIATDTNGCVGQAARGFEIYPDVTADFTADPVCYGQPTRLSDKSITAANGPVDGWSWSLGEGSLAQDSLLAFTYPQFGDYTTALVVTTIHGCKDTATKKVQVYDQPEVAFAFTPECAYNEVPFVNQTAFTYPTITWNWNYGDGSTDPLKDPKHLFALHGQYEVVLIGINDKGCTDTMTQTVEVFPVPTALVVTESACQDKAITLTSSSIVPTPGQINRTLWSLSDQSTSNEVEWQHNFAQAGRYIAALKVTTKDGCMDSTSRELVAYPLPQPAFEVAAVCEQSEVQFVNKTTIDQTIAGDNIASWTWNYGDGSKQGSIPAPRHAYAKDGTYTVLLTIQSEKGCESTLAKELEIYPRPAAPELVEDTACFRNRAFLMALPDQITDHVDWFYQVTDTAAFEVAFSYATPELLQTVTYFVQAVSDKGCQSVKVPVRGFVFDQSRFEIAASDTLVLLPEAAIALKVVGSGIVDNVVWSFGDEVNANGPAAAISNATSHLYTASGIYEVSAMVTDSHGCTYNLGKEVEVKRITGAYIATAFTPNGDGINDEWSAGFLRVANLTLKVFNRWGQLVYQTNTPDFKWDGSGPNGDDVPSGVYVFHLRATDNTGIAIEETGSLTIIR